jgi:hypothetical protein
LRATCSRLRLQPTSDRRSVGKGNHSLQGFTTGTESSSKCRVLRVARMARRASAMPAIWVSRKSTGRPDRCRSAANAAALCADALSKSRTRPSRSSARTFVKAVSISCRRRPGGNSAMPKWASKTDIAVIQTDWAGCRSSQATTFGSALARISAESTLVSRMVTRSAPGWASDRVTPGGPRSGHDARSARKFANREEDLAHPRS